MNALDTTKLALRRAEERFGEDLAQIYASIQRAAENGFLSTVIGSLDWNKSAVWDSLADVLKAKGFLAAYSSQYGNIRVSWAVPPVENPPE